MPEIVSLATINGGSAIERFDHELKNIVANINDVNTDPKATRKITLELIIKPTEDRTMCAYEIKVNGRPAPMKAVSAFFYLSYQNGEAVAVENNPQQPVFSEFAREVKV